MMKDINNELQRAFRRMQIPQHIHHKRSAPQPCRGALHQLAEIRHSVSETAGLRWQPTEASSALQSRACIYPLT